MDSQPALLRGFREDEVARLRGAVRRAYSVAAESPALKHSFPVGRLFAESLGYSNELLAQLPSDSVDSFAGVSNVALFASIPPGASVLDLGCGAGLDSLIAARRAGPTGRVVGIDFSAAMLGRARQAAATCGLDITFCLGDAESLPLETDSIDLALVNGIFNLNPARAAIFAELARVVRPGGAVYAAELILSESIPRTGQPSDAEWFA